ncbi:FAD-dependent monooxygenase, partial [Klebsiella pneumoniae]|nr:FAD-dependent monooxygenase [Klebsiella pneumoniae]
AEHDEVTLLRGMNCHELEQDEDSATVRGVLTDSEGHARNVEVRARYVVGADGANSFVAEALQLPMHDEGYFFDWLILDMIPTTERD